MPRLTDSVRQERMTRIADAALHCIARNGFAGTSMAEVITESGLSAGSIYSHFDSKGELFRYASASVLDARRDLLARATANGATPGPAAVMRLLFADTVRSGTMPMLPQIWAEAPHDEELAGIVREKLAQIRRILAEGLSGWAALDGGGAEAVAARAGAAADTIMLLFQGMMMRLSVDPQISPEALLRSAETILP